MDLNKLTNALIGSLVGILLGAGLGAVLMSDIVGEALGRPGLALERIGRRFRHLSYEIPFAARPQTPQDGIVLVYLDDESHEKLGQPYDRAWDRNLHAQLIERLNQENAKAAVFDIVFSDVGPDSAANDHFAKALKEFKRGVLAADYSKNTDGTIQIKLPLEPFAEAAMNMGSVEMLPDHDLFVRRHFPGNYKDLISSLDWATAEALGAKITKLDQEQPKSNLKYLQRWINYYGPPGYLESTSFYKAISTNELPAGFFKDKVVYIGARIRTFFSGQRKDEYLSPYSFWLQDSKANSGPEDSQSHYMPGVEIHATIFQNLMKNDWLNRVHPRSDFWIVVGAGFAFGLGFSRLRPFYTMILTPVMIFAVLAIAYYCFVFKYTWFSWFIICAVIIPITALWSMVFNSVNLYVQKRLLVQSLSMYVSASRAKQILKRPDILKPGATKQEVSIIFSDIANFTSMSEGMDSDALARTMNAYFETMVGKGIHGSDGTVVKFIGDAIFAIWNAPEEQVNHQALACKGALLLRDQPCPFLKIKPGLDVRTRIGVHSGVANVGNFGSSTRIDYTALGENINLASRMEGLNKYVGTDVLITGDVYHRVEDLYTVRYCGLFQLKGFEKAVEVYELIGYKEKEEEATKPWRDAFAVGVKCFQDNDLPGAEAAFEELLKTRPNDGPCKFYLKHIHELREHPPTGPWTGKVELKEK